jgi:hypothetical protein
MSRMCGSLCSIQARAIWAGVASCLAATEAITRPSGDPELDRTAQHRPRGSRIGRRSEHAGPGQLHRAEPHPIDGVWTEAPGPHLAGQSLQVPLPSQ